MRAVMIRCRDEGEEEPDEMFFHIFLRACEQENME